METLHGSSRSRIIKDHTKYYTEFNQRVVILSILLVVYFSLVQSFDHILEKKNSLKCAIPMFNSLNLPYASCIY